MTFRFHSYRVARAQQALAVTCFYSFMALLLLDILGVIDAPPALAVSLIAAFGITLSWMSLNVCPNCSTSVFAKSDRYPLSVSNADSFLTPNKNCTKCGTPIPR